MRKYISLLLLLLFLSPTIISSSVTLMGHSHEVCTEDGIHHHDIKEECDFCLFNTLNKSTFFQLQTNNTKQKIISEKNIKPFYSIYLFNEIGFSFTKRGPPIVVNS